MSPERYSATPLVVHRGRADSSSDSRVRWCTQGGVVGWCIPGYSSLSCTTLPGTPPYPGCTLPCVYTACSWATLPCVHCLLLGHPARHPLHCWSILYPAVTRFTVGQSCPETPEESGTRRQNVAQRVLRGERNPGYSYPREEGFLVILVPRVGKAQLLAPCPVITRESENNSE